MNKIEKITIILANLVTVIQKRGDYNLDEYSNKIAALYSSQEPQKLIPKPRFDEVYKQCVENMDKSEPQPYCITEINRDGSITYKRIQPQSVVTPTEGMELSKEEIRQVSIPESYDREMMIARQIAKAQLQKIIDILEG